MSTVCPATEAEEAIRSVSTDGVPSRTHLRLLATTDLHVHVSPYNFFSDRANDAVGLSRTAALARELRAKAPNSILLDNGDFLQGNPMGDYIAYEKGLQPRELHPAIAAMNATGIEVSTLGNHEFDYGLEFLDNALAEAEFPIVCANVVRTVGATPREDTTLIRPYVILERNLIDEAGARVPIKIGFIGATPPQVMRWNRRHLEGKVVARDIVDAVSGFLPRMREEGCDIIVALCHSGIGAAEHTMGMENAAVPLAAIDGIDVVIAGHQHRIFPGKDFEGIGAVDVVAGRIHGKPATMAGCWGSHLGVIDLTMERDVAGWRIVGSESCTRSIFRRESDRSITALVSDDAAVVESVAADHAATLTYVRRPIGRTTAPIHSYFGFVANDPSLQIVAQAQRWYAQPLLADTEHAGLPLLSAGSPLKSGGRGGPEHYTDVPAGDIAIKDVADIYPMTNTLCAVRITGAQLRGWLERAAAIFNRIEPGSRDVPLLNDRFLVFDFDVIDGVTYRIDLSQPSRFDHTGAVVAPDAARILDLMYQGAPVEDAMEFVVISNSYRVSGLGGFPGADSSTLILEGPDTNQEALARYIAKLSTVNPSGGQTWSFAPLSGATVTFETGPRSAEYVGRFQGLCLKQIGANEQGFVVYRLALRRDEIGTHADG